jgi:mono/diheme cytochrome c family protein
MLWRWALGAVGGAALAWAGYSTVVHVKSEAYLRSFPKPALRDLQYRDDAASIARGDHLVRTRGCRGCHGDDLAGEEMWGFAVAPNLPALARSETLTTLDAAIRHGVGRDGKALYSMPSYNFIRLTDDDFLDMIAYLRSVPVVEKKLPKPTLPRAVRADLAFGRDMAVPDYIDRVPPLTRADDPDQRIARGEYIAMTTCNECHGLSLRADYPWVDDAPAPDLIIVGGYPEADFRKLMKTGIAIGERELRMMSGVARGRFAYFTDDEVSDVYAFLRDMSARAASE